MQDLLCHNDDHRYRLCPNGNKRKNTIVAVANDLEKDIISHAITTKQHSLFAVI
jgi:hypothetical protein